MTALRLRPLRPQDEADAIAAHEELARDGFEFLLDWRRGMPWPAYLHRLEQQRRGYAGEILRQALVVARAVGVDAALVTCDDDNLASARVIEGAGGVREDVREGPGGMRTRRYWIA